MNPLYEKKMKDERLRLMNKQIVAVYKELDRVYDKLLLWGEANKARDKRHYQLKNMLIIKGQTPAESLSWDPVLHKTYTNLTLAMAACKLKKIKEKIKDQSDVDKEILGYGWGSFSGKKNRRDEASPLLGNADEDFSSPPALKRYRS